MEEDRNYLRRSYFDQDGNGDLPNRIEGALFGDEEAENEMAVGEKLKEENYYKYHENVSYYDPRGQPYSYFYITVMGQIEFGEFTGELDGLQIHYSFVAGEDWGVSDGVGSGTGQYAFKG